MPHPFVISKGRRIRESACYVRRGSDLNAKIILGGISNGRTEEV